MAEVKLSDISVVVATKNEAAHLEDCIGSLLIAGQGEAEIIFVDDQSADESLSILKKYEGKVQILKGEGKGPGRARNQAVRATTRPWIAFTDGDCKVDSQWLAKLCEGLKGYPAEFASVGGIQVISLKASSTEQLIGKFLESLGFMSDYIHNSTAVRQVKHNPTCNVLYSREALEKVNGFDETLWPCEDLELDIRLSKLGFKSLLQPQAMVEHRRPATFRGLFGMMKRYGFGHAQLVKKHGPCQFLHIFPLIAPLGIIATIYFLGKASHIFAWIIAAAVGLLSWRARCLKNGIIFTLLLGPSIVCWLYGFYTGLIGQRRIAKENE